MVFGVGFSAQMSDAQLNTQMNHERRMALANRATPHKFGAIAAEEKQLNMANVINFANEEAYKNMEQRHQNRNASWAASFGGIHFEAKA